MSEVFKCFGFMILGMAISEYYNLRVRCSYRDGRKDTYDKKNSGGEVNAKSTYRTGCGI